jgi:perosamine synthetase
MKNNDYSGEVDAKNLAKEILLRLKLMFPGHEGVMPLHSPVFYERSEELVIDCIRSTFVSSVGSCVALFEEEVAKACDTEFCVSTTNGTAALQVAMRVSGVESGHESLMPSLTFVATPNAASYLGAIPHFVDVDPQTLAMDPDVLRRHLMRCSTYRNGKLLNKKTNRQISSILAVHVFGHPADMSGLRKIADEFELPLIEDAAGALGSELEGRRVGSFGDLGVVSFNGNKLITTGGGGAIVTNSQDLADAARHISTTAKRSHGWSFVHDQIGYNFRMPSLNAALGLSQIENLDGLLTAKRKIAARYQEYFKNFDEVSILKQPENSNSNFWLNNIILERFNENLCEEIIQELNHMGINARPIWTPMHYLEIYRNSPKTSLSVTESIVKKIISLPSSPYLSEYF